MLVETAKLQQPASRRRADEPTYGGARVAEPVEPEPGSPSLRAQWSAFRAANPQVWDLFVRFALEAAERGRRLGAKAVWERMRWEVALDSRGDEYRLNNNYPSYAARDFAHEYPQHAEFFEFRKAEGDP